MVTSATYRQSSRVTSQLLDRDPDNQLLARHGRLRLPSWMLRDQALAVSGLLSGQIGGPPVRPYQPEGIWAEATFGKIRYQPDSGENLYRRSIYTFWRRIVGPTMFFDTARRQTCEVKPTVTNTPLHALTTLNETTFWEASRALAERVLASGGADTVEERIQQAFRLATGRMPSPHELQPLVRRLRLLDDQFRGNPEDAEQLLSVGDSPLDQSLDVAEHAAYALLCNLLLNLDETLTGE
jgi:hypothetical protein